MTRAERMIKNSARLRNAVNAIGGLKATSKLIKTAALSYSRLTKWQRVALPSVIEFGANMLSGALGVGSCVSLGKAIKNSL
ncbi:MAG: hypothetical protein LBT54_02530 [Bifidobacteriaceae bacterium]|nr:hypothetical protein [Bifidobacteriaceae bacterium]